MVAVYVSVWQVISLNDKQQLMSSPLKTKCHLISVTHNSAPQETGCHTAGCHMLQHSLTCLLPLQRLFFLTQTLAYFWTPIEVLVVNNSPKKFLDAKGCNLLSF